MLRLFTQNYMGTSGNGCVAMSRWHVIAPLALAALLMCGSYSMCKTNLLAWCVCVLSVTGPCYWSAMVPTCCMLMQAYVASSRGSHLIVTLLKIRVMARRCL